MKKLALKPIRIQPGAARKTAAQLEADLRENFHAIERAYLSAAGELSELGLLADKVPEMYNGLQGCLFPDFDGMKPLLTIDFSTSAAKYYTIAERVNTDISDVWIVRDTLLFRLTTTGTDIDQIVDVFVQFGGALAGPQMMARSSTRSTSGATTGLRYLRAAYPLALNSGYPWLIDVYPYNATTRHVKVEVFKTSPAVAWVRDPQESTYDSSTHKNTSLTMYTNRGISVNGTVPITASSANTAPYINSYLSQFVAGTLPKSGMALKNGALCYIATDGKIYHTSNKTKPILTDAGMSVLSGTTYNANATVSYLYMRQRFSWTPLTADTTMTKDTLALGDPVYLRCTMSNGQVYSDNHLSKTMAAGYTWIFVGVAASNTAINVDMVGKHFLTLNSAGKLTHIDGHEIAA